MSERMGTVPPVVMMLLTALTVAHSLTAVITSSSSISSRSLVSSVARAVSDNSWKLFDLNTFYNESMGHTYCTSKFKTLGSATVMATS